MRCLLFRQICRCLFVGALAAQAQIVPGSSLTHRLLSFVLHTLTPCLAASCTLSTMEWMRRETKHETEASAASCMASKESQGLPKHEKAPHGHEPAGQISAVERGMLWCMHMTDMILAGRSIW